MRAAIFDDAALPGVTCITKRHFQRVSSQTKSDAFLQLWARFECRVLLLFNGGAGEAVAWTRRSTQFVCPSIQKYSESRRLTLQESKTVSRQAAAVGWPLIHHKSLSESAQPSSVFINKLHNLCSSSKSLVYT